MPKAVANLWCEVCWEDIPEGEYYGKLTDPRKPKIWVICNNCISELWRVRHHENQVIPE